MKLLEQQLKEIKENNLNKLKIICDVYDICKTPNYAPISMMAYYCSNNFLVCPKREYIIWLKERRENE